MDTMLLLLILVIELVLQTTDVILLSPDLRAAAKNLESYRADYRFLQENGIHTMTQLEAVIPDVQSQIDALEVERSKADNTRRRARTPEEQQEAKDHKKENLPRKLRRCGRSYGRQKRFWTSPRIYTNYCKKNGPVAKYAHEKNHIDHPERAWLMWFFALELNYHEKLWNANSVYRS